MNNLATDHERPTPRIRRSRRGWGQAARLALAVLACTFAGAGQAQNDYSNLDKAVDDLAERLVDKGNLQGKTVLVRPGDFFEMGSERSLPLSEHLAWKFITDLRRHGAEPVSGSADESKAITLHGRWREESGSGKLLLSVEVKQLAGAGLNERRNLATRQARVPVASIDGAHLEPDLGSHGRHVVRQLERRIEKYVSGNGRFRLHILPFKADGIPEPERFNRYLLGKWRPAFADSHRFETVAGTAEFDGELHGEFFVSGRRIDASLFIRDNQRVEVAAATVEMDSGLFPSGVVGTGDEDVPVVTGGQPVPGGTSGGGATGGSTSGGGSPEDEAPDALHRAAEAGDVNGLRAALKAEADVDARDGKGWTALMHAVAKGYPLLVEPLLEARADPDVRAPDGATALFMAADERHTEIIVLLMEAEADVSVRGPKGRKTAVDVARVRYGDAETARRGGEPLAVLALLEGMSLDDAAYARAEALGTAAAYAEYRSSYPEGRHAEEAARRERERTAGRQFRDCAECPKLVVVSEETYMMGSPSSEEGRGGDEGPVHRVTIGRPFAVGVYEVTFGEWDACVSGGGCGGYRPDDGGWGRGPRPVVNVSWNDAKAYVDWLSSETGEAYRLLSEAEWEYVARAGTRTRYWWGDEIGRNRANCAGCGSRWDGGQTAPVGSFSANGFGLHDVHGNVWERVEDCWNVSYRGAPSDGSAWESGNCSRRVVRGGSWVDDPRSLRSANRIRKLLRLPGPLCRIPRCPDVYALSHYLLTSVVQGVPPPGRFLSGVFAAPVTWDEPGCRQALRRPDPAQPESVCRLRACKRKSCASNTNSSPGA